MEGQGPPEQPTGPPQPPGGQVPPGQPPHGAQPPHVQGPPPPAGWAPQPPRYGPWLLASWGYRAAALLIDVLIAFAVAGLIGGVLVLAGADGDTALGTGVIALLVIWPLVMGVPMALTGGQSLGKRAASIHVVREDGKRPGIGSSLVRDSLARGLFHVIPFGAFVNYLWATGDARQTLHDKMSSTRVVRGPEYDRRRTPMIAMAVTASVLILGGFGALGALSEDPDNGYSSFEQTGWVEGCTEGDDGLPEAECECQFAHIKSHMPYERFSDWIDENERDPEGTPLPREVVDAREACD